VEDADVVGRCEREVCGTEVMKKDEAAEPGRDEDERVRERDGRE